MMNITGIRETRRGRFALFCEETFLFSVDGETLLRYDIKEGSSLTDEELSSLKESSDTRKAKDQALRFLARRAHGQQELYQKLCRSQDEYSAAAALASMTELGLMDDGQFAAQRAEMLAQKGKSRFEIRHDLQALGIDAETVQQTLENLELDDEKSIERLIRKRYLEKLLAGKQQAVVAALARRGFSQRDIWNALETVLAEQENE